MRAGPAMRDLRSLLVADQLLAVADLPLPASASAPPFAALIEQLTSGLLDAERRQIEAAAPPPGEERGSSLLNAWWLWGGVGAAVLLSGAALLYYTLDDGGAAPAAPPPGDPDKGTIRLVF